MREFIDIVESLRPDLADLPRIVIKAGTRLYHGTDAVENFDRIDQPAWFTTGAAAAARWAGWASYRDSGKTFGARRVLAFELIRDVELLDVRTHALWSELAERLTGDPEASPWTMARELVGRADGWDGRTEIMLTNPSVCLRHIDTRKVPGDTRRHGGDA